jgi:hypothetical protein
MVRYLLVRKSMTRAIVEAQFGPGVESSVQELDRQQILKTGLAAENVDVTVC